MTKEYLTLVEASEFAGIKRATIYNYLNDLGIATLRVGRDRRAYISLADAKRLKEYKEKPWKVRVETRKKKDEVA